MAGWALLGVWQLLLELREAVSAHARLMPARTGSLVQWRCQAGTRGGWAAATNHLPRALWLQVQRDLAAFRRQLEAELRRALAAAAEPQAASNSSSSSSSSSSNGGGWLSRLLRGTRRGDTAASSDSGSSGGGSSRQLTVGQIQSGWHPGLKHAAADLNALIKQYNGAVLADRETFGASWPLDRMRLLEMRDEVDAALAAIDGGGGGGGSSSGGGIAGSAA